ncbi:ExbD/TolR family protein [Carnimonas nigrificans]|uniref:ExbD/TolR family protein n=1 Tax=Carnimonas nigrificans TaxID=64323 RepID=UPI000470943C|nr:biopolymer transporter ExbD [Carnimonas nigrificans]
MAFSDNSDDDDVLSEMNVTPLVDVMLVLLVIFIVTAPLLTKAIPLNLPKTDAVAPADQPDPVIVSIDKEGKYYIDQEALSLDALQQRVASAHEANERTGIQLRADETTEYGPIAKAMATIQKAGVTRVNVITSPN